MKKKKNYFFYFFLTVIKHQGGIQVIYSKNIDNELHSAYHDERRDEGLSPVQLTSERNSMVGAELVGLRDGGNKYSQSSPTPKKEMKSFLDELKPDPLAKKIEESPNSAIKVNVDNLEIFNSSKKDMLQPYKDFQEFEKSIKKRIITQPCSLFYHTQSFTCLCKNEIKYINSMDIHVSNLQANLSYKDIILLYETLLIQQE